MEGKTIQLNVPVRIEQVEKLSKAVAITMASREKNENNKRITKATFLRSLIDVVDFDEADLKNIANEEELQSTLKKQINKTEPSEGEIITEKKIDVASLSTIYKKFADDDKKKSIASDFINALFEKELVDAQSSADLWEKILVESANATK